MLSEHIYCVLYASTCTVGIVVDLNVFITSIQLSWQRGKLAGWTRNWSEHFSYMKWLSTLSYTRVLTS